jgi:protein-S-isoprenylcysteine O-methyltransferase Ste14
MVRDPQLLTIPQCPRHHASACAGRQRYGWRIEITPFEPTPYLITRGPYRYSCNPIYVGHLAIWIGWAIFYGSVPVALGALVMWMLMSFVVLPYEERGLVRQLGEPYERYRREVGRWFGRLDRRPRP